MSSSPRSTAVSSNAQVGKVTFPRVSCFCSPKKDLSNAGSSTSPSRVLDAMPPITAVASGRCTSLPAEVEMVDGREQHAQLVATLLFEHIPDLAPLARGLHRREHLVGRNAEPREPPSVGADLQHGQAQRPLDTHVPGAGGAAQDAFDAPPELGELVQVRAEQLNRHVRARPRDHLVGAVFDRLRDGHEGGRHFRLDGGLHLFAEGIEIVGGGPLLLRLELHQEPK